jgi:hypothetical protein
MIVIISVRHKLAEYKRVLLSSLIQNVSPPKMRRKAFYLTTLGSTQAFKEAAAAWS